MAPPPFSSHRRTLGRRARLTVAAAGLVLLVAGAVGLCPSRAGAAVVHGLGFQATVLGWTSWYGSYQLPSVGTVWCIDHGLHAPDATYAYRPTEVDRPAATTTAMAWLLVEHGAVSQPAAAAAVMLVLHDLMGATYPYGRLDVDTLQPRNLAGFGGQEATVLSLARAWKAEALAHAHLRAPVALHLDTAATSSLDAPPASVTASLVDAGGQAVGGVSVTLTGPGVPGGHTTAVADPGGHAHVALADPPPTGQITATASVADLHLSAFSAGPSAQRVARPARTTVGASLSWAAPALATLQQISATKVDGVTGTALPGAVYDLYRRLPVGDDATDAGESNLHHPAAPDDHPPRRTPPPDAALLDGFQWLGRATSDAAGRLTWPPQAVGFAYCAREVSAPAGYALDPDLVCTPAVVATDEPAALDLVDLPTTTTTTAPSPTPPPATATTTPASTTAVTAPTSMPPATPPPTTRHPTATTVPGSPPSELAFTGAAARRWASVGLGLLLLGLAAVASRRPRPPG